MQTYQFTYDPLGRLLSQTRAGTTMSFEYDAVGNRTKRTDYNGTVTNYAYDNLNRLTSGSLGTYTYDDISQMLTATNYHGTVSFTHDNRGRIDTTTDVYGKVIDYDYDANGNRTSLNLNGTGYTGYAYDNADRLQSITNVSENAVTNYGYDSADRLASKALPSGITTIYEYDGMSRLARLTDQNAGGTLSDRQYVYNTANQIASITVPSRTRTYAYDNLDRLTGVTDSVSGVTESYTYDAIGNRTASHHSSTYTHSPFNRLTATASATYTYNNNGSMTSRTDANGTMTFGHDSDGRLVYAQSDNPEYFEFAEYRYDALGRRISKEEPYDLPWSFTYDGDNMLVQTWGNAPTTFQNGPGIDNKLSMRLAGSTTTTYFHPDHLGTRVGTSDSSGAFGGGTAIPDSFGIGSTDFTGRENDNFTSLMYYRARMYDPQLGRFISEDPIGFAGGDVNLYGYVRNQPLMLRDPFGWFPSIFDRFFASTHRNITERALAGYATQDQIRSIARSNVEFDKRTQDSIYAPYHAMRRYGQTSVEDARAESNEFVRDKICTARIYASRGWNTYAMYELGKAIHTLQDVKSPAHAGFQEAWPGDLLSMALNVPHYVSEAAFPGAENTSAAEQATRDAWRYFNGAPMPNDFFR